MKTGLSTFLRTCHRLCVFFGRWEGSLRAAIAASALSLEDKQKLYNSIDAIKAGCAAVEVIRVKWE